MLREYQAIITLYVGTIIEGINMGYSAIALPDLLLEMENSTHGSSLPTIVATQEQLSWFVSIINVGQIFGSLLGGYFALVRGPRLTVMMMSVPGLLGWILISLAPHLSLLIIGRFLAGLASAAFITINPLLVAQYSQRSRRGGFLAMTTLMGSVGITLVYSLGAVLNWRIVAAVPPVLILGLLATLSLLPESPIWLLGHRGREAAGEALQWLRGTKDVGEELEELANLQETQEKGLGLRDAILNLSKPSVHRPVLLVAANFLLVMMTGPYAVVYYAVQVFQDAGVDVDAHVAAILIAVIRILGGVSAILLIHRLPRRLVASVSVGSMSVSMAVLGTVLYLKSTGESSPLLRGLPIACVIMYMFSFCAGVGPLQWVWQGELMPPEYKVLSGLVVAFWSLVVFVVTKVFPSLLLCLEPHGTYWVFSGICALCLIFYLTVMPETKGMSARQIQIMFGKNKEKIFNM